MYRGEKRKEEGVMEARRLESLKQIAAGIAAQFGDKCEVVIHDVSGSHPEHTIVHIENGHVSGRKVGDGASKVVMEQLEHQNDQPQDHLCYLTRTPDGKILQVIVPVYPQRARRGDGHLLHQLRHQQHDADASGAGRVHAHPGQGAVRAGEDHQRQRRAGRSHPASPWRWWASRRR